MQPDLALPTLMDALPLAIAMTVGEDHRVYYLNAAFRQLPGALGRDALGRRFLELLPQEEFSRALTTAYRSGEPVRGRSVECRLPRGTTYWDYTIWPVREGDRSVRLVIVLDEVTEELERQAASLRREELLQSLLALEPVAVAVLRGPDLRYEYANPAYEALSGRPVEECRGQAFAVLCMDCLGDEVVRAVEASYREGTARVLHDVRLPSLDAGGPYRHASFHLVPTRDRNGTVNGVMVAIWETTELVSARQAAAEHAARLEAMLASMTEGVVLLGPGYRLEYVNQAARRFGDRVQLTGRSVAEVFEEYRPRDGHGQPLTLNNTPLPRILQGETFSGYEVVMHPPSADRDVVLSFNGAPVLGPGGVVIGALLVFRDVTHVREMDRLKDELIGLVSHELRTPTTTIRAGLNLMRRYGPALEPAMEQVLRDMEDEASRLHYLIENMLGLARLSAGAEIATEPVHARKVIRTVTAELSARSATHTITVDVPEDLPLVESQPGYLSQVVRNLVENARKYAPRGTEITVSAAVEGDHVVFSVLDRGPGVPPEERELIFEAFHRTKDAADRAGGAGLGLTLCRRLVEAQAGRIWVEDRPDGGAAFRFSLPVVDAPVGDDPPGP